MVDLETAIGTPPAAPTLIPTSRYTDPAFAALEAERLWPAVWQVACTTQHVARPGDVFELRSGALSVLVVRGDDGELRAFQNACRHRGTALCDGQASGLTELRCGYHRWAWDLRGRLREIPSRRGFGVVDDEALGLVPARVGVWGPLVFVAVDSGGAVPPLDEWLDPLPADAAWARLDEFRCVATTRTPVAANWKAVADGFSETYHIQGLHPEMLASIDDVHAPQTLWERHSKSYQRYVVPSPRASRHVTDDEVWASFVLTQSGRLGPDHVAGSPMPPVPPGSTLRDVVAQLVRDVVAPLGARMDDLDTEQVLGLSQYNLFPNASVLVWGEMVNVLVARPSSVDPADPHHAELVTFLLVRHGPDAPVAGAAPPVDVDAPVGTDLGMILNQDVAVLEKVHRGMRQPGMQHLVLSSEERRITHFHTNLEQALRLDG